MLFDLGKVSMTSRSHFSTAKQGTVCEIHTLKKGMGKIKVFACSDNNNGDPKGTMQDVFLTTNKDCPHLPPPKKKHQTI